MEVAATQSQRPAVGAWMVLAITFAVCAAVVRIEPVVGDSWRGVTWLERSGSWLDLPRQIEWSYTYLNPRFGEALLYVTSASRTAHLVLTPAAIVALLVAVVALGTGRIPRGDRDRRLLVVAIAVICAGVTRIGQDLFYLPFATNYVYGFAIQAWFVLTVRLRLATTGPSPVRWIAAAGMLVLGLAAGLCNEHTGPTLIVAFLALGAVLIRRRPAVWPWVVAGAIGVIAGYLALYFAPANAVRHGGKGTVSVVTRIADHGPLGVLHVLGAFAREAAGALGVLAIAAVVHLRRRTMPRAAWWLLAAAIAIVVTLLGSPTWAGRLFLAPALLVVAAAIAALAPVRVPRAVRALAIAIAIVHAAVFFEVQADLHADYAARDAQLRRAPPGSVPVVDPVRHWAPVHWGFGEDLRYDGWRTWIASHYGLARIDLATE